MQWAVVEGNQRWLESRELKNYLIRGAVRMAGVTYPSREWGAYGIIVSGGRRFKKVFKEKLKESAKKS